MPHDLLLGLATMLVLGIVIHWVAWRLKLPAILLLLLAGFVVGPIANLVDPDVLFGDVLFPGVSLAVAVILFEGGLKLKWSRVTGFKSTVLRLVGIGGLLTWTLTTLAAWLILDFGIDLALLIGAIMIVTGPTVIGPLLRHIRLRSRVSSLLSWEAIVNDPIGALLAALVFQSILAGGLQAAVAQSFQGLAVTLLGGSALAGLSALALIIALKRYWIPDFLESPMTLALVLGVYTASNLLQQEAGLFSVTLMGIILANQKSVKVGHIIEFQENLRMLLIPALFILLAARLDLETVAQLRGQSLLFLGALIFVVRPLSVLGATFNSNISWRERVFLCGMAPRGIVAAAVASLFALQLKQIEVPRAEQLHSETFLVITGTVAFYGLGGALLGRWLKLTEPQPQGVLIVGAHAWARDIAEAIQALGFQAMVLDRGPGTKDAASSHEHVDLTGIGKLIALTPTDEVNVLAGLQLEPRLGRENIFHLAARSSEKATSEDMVESRRRGRILFDVAVTFDELDTRMRSGEEVRILDLWETEKADNFRRNHPAALPLFFARDQTLHVCAADFQFTPRPGDMVICIEPA